MISEKKSKTRYRHVLNSLQQLHDITTTALNSSDPNAEFYKIATEMMNNETTNRLMTLYQIAHKAPFPLQQWLDKIADNAWQLILEKALKYINALWEHQILDEYNYRLINHYPITPHAKTPLQMNYFNQFYGHGGSLDEFFNQFFALFVDTKSKPWKLKSNYHHHLKIQKNTLSYFEQIAKLRKYYFSINNKVASINLTIIPRSLDNNLKSVQISFGEQSLSYRHGPQIAKTIRWPYPSNNQKTKLVITDFENHQQVYSKAGPWSLFEFLNDKKIISVRHFEKHNNQGVLVTIKLQHHHASFELIGSIPMSAMQLKTFTHTPIPKKL